MKWAYFAVISAGTFALPACSDDASQGGSGSGANNPGGSSSQGAGAPQGGNGEGAGNPSGGNNPSGGGGAGGGTNCDCGGKECGPDGCGGTCGTCSGSDTCDLATGQCTSELCDNNCGGECGECPSNSSYTLTCTQFGVCKCNATCSPNCDGKSCGDDSCGGSCGACDAGSVCAYQGGNNWACGSFAGTDPSMTFFVTSRGTYDQGGNLGGLAGGDSICAQLAADAGVTGKIWRAYLSTAGNAARDRIGAGPWYNAAGDAIVSEQCGANCIDDLHFNGVAPELVLTEYGTQIDWALAHDIMTGSNEDGTPSGADCEGWTSNSENVQVTVGHSNEAYALLNAHTTGCDRVSMNCTAGQGHLYCFAL